jgi:hypothetical protein
MKRKLIYIFLCSLALDELQSNFWEQRHLEELLLKGSGSNVPYIVKLEDFLFSTIPVVSSSFELLFDWYRKKPLTIKEIIIELI